MERADWYLVVAAVVLGQFALLAIEFLRSQMERWQRRRDHNNDFQRETLIELQDVIHRFVLGISLILHNMEREKTGEQPHKWKALGDPGEMTQAAGPRIAILAERVKDDKLRELVNGLQTGYGVLPHSRTEQELAETLDGIRRIQRVANRRIGELLRAL